MSGKTPWNIAASVRQRLLNKARSGHRPFSELLQYYAMERFLYRLSKSPHANRFILKGALMLRAWRSPEFRSTMDIDLLGKTDNGEAEIVSQIRDILALEIPPDGLVFDPASIRAERITEDADYEGIRIRFRGMLDSARVNMQIDIGFGDIIYPGPENADLPVILDLPAPRLLCYSRESTIAEKFEAMVKLGELNSRMKDFYDIWLLSRQFDFESEKLAEAIRLTFDRRGTAMPNEAAVFTKDFINAKQTQWKAFIKKLKQDHVPQSFAYIVAAVSAFLGPLAAALSAGTKATDRWTAPGPWISKTQHDNR
ncbi:MAG: nucleotidyl transferase AbiEii/AbiGii toxin family protein [Nitrospiraceae bacterium]|nr:nucleotidyl transferase AbiEii/AbiGii toxin family protein [Nitrospiraceae bacterium]